MIHHMFLRFWNQLDSARLLARPLSARRNYDNGKQAESLIAPSDSARKRPVNILVAHLARGSLILVDSARHELPIKEITGTY